MTGYKTKVSRIAKHMSEIKNPFGWNQICQYAINKAIAKFGTDQTKDEILEKIWQSASVSITDLPDYYKSGKTATTKPAQSKPARKKLFNKSNH